MLHNLVVTYTVKSLFTDGYYTSHQSLRLNWEGVRKMVADLGLGSVELASSFIPTGDSLRITNP